MENFMWQGVEAPNHSYSISYKRDCGEFLIAEAFGKDKRVHCPFCHSDKLKWFNWSEAKEHDDPLYAICENSHTVKREDLLIKLDREDYQKIIEEPRK